MGVVNDGDPWWSEISPSDSLNLGCAGATDTDVRRLPGREDGRASGLVGVSSPKQCWWGSLRHCEGGATLWWDGGVGGLGWG